MQYVDLVIQWYSVKTNLNVTDLWLNYFTKNLQIKSSAENCRIKRKLTNYSPSSAKFVHLRFRLPTVNTTNNRRTLYIVNICLQPIGVSIQTIHYKLKFVIDQPYYSNTLQNYIFEVIFILLQLGINARWQYSLFTVKKMFRN